MKSCEFSPNLIYSSSEWDRSQPLMHYLGVGFKSWELDVLLHAHDDLPLFERNKKLQPVLLFDCFANNNFENHKRWPIMKHQK